MPQQDQSSKLGKSSSPVVDRVIQNSKDSQREFKPDPSNAYNKKTVKVG